MSSGTKSFSWGHFLSTMVGCLICYGGFEVFNSVDMSAGGSMNAFFSWVLWIFGVILMIVGLFVAFLCVFQIYSTDLNSVE